MDLCLRPAEEMLLVGLGGDEAFGEKGCDMTESWLRPLVRLLRLLPLLPRCSRSYTSFSL
jgi:hypothetical protein